MGIGSIGPAMNNPLFDIAGFQVLLWHVIVAVAAVLAIVLVCVIVAVCCKKSRKKAEQAVENQSAETPVSQSAETQDEQPVQETVVASEDQQPESVASVAQEEHIAEQTQDGDGKQSSSRPKNYHVSLREDGKWQVKLGKGEKALKLFDTQAEAIAFAKEKAKNQDGHITIHKVDGKIRKQRY